MENKSESYVGDFDQNMDDFLLNDVIEEPRQRNKISFDFTEPILKKTRVWKKKTNKQRDLNKLKIQK